MDQPDAAGGHKFTAEDKRLPELDHEKEIDGIINTEPK